MRHTVCSASFGLIAVVSFASASCAANGFHGASPTKDPVPMPTATSLTVRSGMIAGISRKRVDGKHAPATLVAFDGTSCTVPPTRYKGIETGDNVTCTWTTSARLP